MYRKNLLIIIGLSLSVSHVFGQVDTVGRAGTKLITDRLKPGLNQYMIYMMDAKSKKTMSFWYWIRNVSFVERNGEKVFEINQQWLGADSLSYRKVYSVNNTGDFSPLYHAETVKGTVRAYNWYRDRMIGADSVAGNTKNGFSLGFKVPNYNWNLDIETLEMLPLAEGKTFAINFYDAGQGSPEYIIYKVTGREIITTYEGSRIDCWKLYTEGSNGDRRFSETFWISEKKHLFIKEEDRYGSGYRLKIRMPESTPNPLKIYITK